MRLRRRHRDSLMKESPCAAKERTKGRNGSEGGSEADSLWWWGRMIHIRCIPKLMINSFNIYQYCQHIEYTMDG